MTRQENNWAMEEAPAMIPTHMPKLLWIHKTLLTTLETCNSAQPTTTLSSTSDPVATVLSIARE